MTLAEPYATTLAEPDATTLAEPDAPTLAEPDATTNRPCSMCRQVSLSFLCWSYSAWVVMVMQVTGVSWLRCEADVDRILCAPGRPGR